MPSEYERMVAGQLYRPSDPELKALRMKHRQVAREFNQTREQDREARAAYLSQIFGQIGRNGHVTPPLYVDYGYNITIGDNFYANYDAILLDVAPITIGNNVMFGPRVSLLTPGHPIDAEVRNSGLEFGQAITIEDDVWLGGQVVVNPGVTIGARTIVGSGAVVTKDLPADVIAVGNPARVLRKVTSADRQFWQSQADAYAKSAE